MYVVTFGISVVLIAVAMNQKQYKYKYAICIIGALLIPALLAGLRDYSIGFDLSLYGNAWFDNALKYDSMHAYILKANEYSMGTGYAVVNYLCSRLSSSAHFFYYVYAQIQTILLFWALKDYEKYISLPFAFFVYYFTYYNTSLNILRQIMAILIVLLSYKYVFKKQLILFLICILAAVSFHSSAIVAVVLYPINWVLNNKSKKIAKGLIIGASICLIGTYGILIKSIAGMGIESFSRYAHYTEDEGGGGRYIRLVFWGGFFALFYLRKNRIKRSIQENYGIVLMQKKLYGNSSVIVPSLELIEICMWFSLVGSVINYLTGAWLIRIVYYFDIISVFSFPLITKSLAIRNNEEKESPFWSYVIVGAFVFVYWMIVYVIRNGSATFPYKFMKS